MAKGARRARVVASLIAVAVLGLAVWAWNPLYWRITSRQVIIEDASAISDGVYYPSWLTYGVRRWRGSGNVATDTPSTYKIPHGGYSEYYDDNGFLAAKGWYRDGFCIRLTQWRIDGTIWQQTRSRGDPDNIGETKTVVLPEIVAGEIG